MIELWAEIGSPKSIDEALELTHRVHDAGAHAVKAQWYHPDTLVIPSAKRYDKTSGLAATQYEVFKGAYGYSKWEPVISLCRDLGLKFIPSVFDFKAIKTAAAFELDTVKIASGDLTYHALIREASSQFRVALSTGAATLAEVGAAVAQLTHRDEYSHILMACHLEYPTPYSRANIARTYALQDNFPFMLPGFSDHTPGVETIPLIVASGCQVIEKHFTLQSGQGYDSDFALTPTDLRNAVLKIEGTVAVMGDAYLEPDAGELPARDGARRSPYAARAIPAGTPITEDDIAILRPYYGIDPNEASKLVGQIHAVDIPKYGEFRYG